MTVEDDMRERRDREAARVGARKMPAPFIAKVVGVSFVPGYPDNLHMLRDSADDAERRGEGLPVVLVRNPANEYDPIAIQVHIPSLGEEWGFIGHLTRPIAARMAPEIDDGHEWRAEVVSVLIDPDHPDRPGISIRCDRAPEQE